MSIPPEDDVRVIAHRQRRRQALKAVALGGVAVATLIGALLVVSIRDDPATTATASPGEEITVTADLVEFGDRLVGLIGNMARADGRTYVIGGQYKSDLDLLSAPEEAVLAAFDEDGRELWRTELDGRPTAVVVADGDVWVRRYEPEGAMIDPDSNEVTVLSRIDAFDGRILGHVTIEHMWDLVGAFGSVWVTTQEHSGDGVRPGRLVRIDPDLSITSVEVRVFEGECHHGDGTADDGGWCPDSATAGAGAIWVPLKDDGVAMIDPDTNEVTVIPIDDIGHEVLQVAFDGDVAYVASKYQVTSIVDGEVRATVTPGEIRYLGPMDGVFGVLHPGGRFQVLGANDPMVMEYRDVATEEMAGAREIDGEAWTETGRNYNLRRIELLPVSAGDG